MRSANDAPATIADYAERADKNKETIRGYSGKQPGDPVRAAKAIIEAVERKDSPFNLLLGIAALRGARMKLESLKQDFDANASISEGADFPEAAQGK